MHHSKPDLPTARLIAEKAPATADRIHLHRTSSLRPLIPAENQQIRDRGEPTPSATAGQPSATAEMYVIHGNGSPDTAGKNEWPNFSDNANNATQSSKIKMDN